MNASRGTVGTSEAKRKFSELLERATSGETITITKRGEAVAKLVPAKTPDRATFEMLFREMDEIREQSVLNPPGKRRLSIKQLIEEGRK